MKQLAKTEQWFDNMENKLLITIKHWGIEREHETLKPLNDGKGVWNYYVSIPEQLFPNAFSHLWLEDNLVKFIESSPWRVTHKYEDSPIYNLDWHCGCTYYAKHGHSVGHRVVEFGCDFSHLYDRERRYNYTLEEVHSEALHTAKQILDYLNNYVPPNTRS